MRVSTSEAEVCFYSLSKKNQAPTAQFEFDCTNFRDPGGHAPFKLKNLDGKSKEVQEWIKEDRKFPALCQQIELLTADLIDAQHNKWVTFGFRDHHGKWISSALVELLADRLSEKGYKVAVLHLES